MDLLTRLNLFLILSCNIDREIGLFLALEKGEVRVFNEYIRRIGLVVSSPLRREIYATHKLIEAQYEGYPQQLPVQNI